MKTYVLTISERFPKAHKRSGEPTGFPLAIKHYRKIHTIRGNYELWAKRFKKITEGEAVLSVRVWSGTPYQSKQHEIFRFDKTWGIGVEKLTWKEMIMTTQSCIQKPDERIYVPEISTVYELAENDGLSYPDFRDWFKRADFTKPMAIIHFTPFRYEK